MQAQSTSCQHLKTYGDRRRTRFAIHPRGPGSLNGRDLGSIFLPRKQLIAIGIPYETPSATTDAEMMALKALFKIVNVESRCV
jgi:hypothetical protein